MAEKHERCPDCGTPLVDLERRLEVTDADASHRHHAVDCVRVLKAVIDEANEILMDTRSHDIEHQIECHADTLPLAFRTTAGGADRACDVLQRVIWARFPDEAPKTTAWAKCTSCGAPVLINGTFCGDCTASGRI